MVLQTSAHARHDLKYHFVWCPKYRRLALKGNIGKYVLRVIYEVAEQYDFTVLEMVVMPDHVHLFISVLPAVSPTALIQKIKRALPIGKCFVASRTSSGFCGAVLCGSEVP